jgi:hypothetical protein
MGNQIAALNSKKSARRLLLLGSRLRRADVPECLEHGRLCLPTTHAVPTDSMQSIGGSRDRSWILIWREAVSTARRRTSTAPSIGLAPPSSYCQRWNWRRGRYQVRPLISASTSKPTTSAGFFPPSRLARCSSQSPCSSPQRVTAAAGAFFSPVNGAITAMT